MSLLCPACDTELIHFDSGTVLDRYRAEYFRCPACALVTTPETPWLEEAYSTAIHSADSGLLRRARRDSMVTNLIIRGEGLAAGRFLDWAGGYGVFTQLMRDRGLDYWHHDDFAQPLFAGRFLDDGAGSFDLVTAFEVLEHLARPRDQLAALAQRTDRILFTTVLQPVPTPRVLQWWYYMPDVGQHITFHTVESLRALGRAFGYELISNGVNWHLFHRVPIGRRTRAMLSPRLVRAGHAALRLRSRLHSRLSG